MSVMQQISRVGVGLCLVAAIPTVSFAQPEAVGGPLTGPTVRDAPFSADATTIVRQTLGDGTRIERHATARYYRDRAGRVRVEQMIIGLDALNLAAEGQVRITVHTDPAHGLAYMLDPVARNAVKIPRSIAGLAVGGGDTFAVPLGGVRFLVFHRGDRLLGLLGARGIDAFNEEPLGTRRIDGVEAVGRRYTMTIPVGQLGNDRPMEFVDERWESPELQMLIYSRSSDPRTGVVEYRLTNIRRTEPPADLFVVPADYTFNSPHEAYITLESAEAVGAKVAPKKRRQ